MVIVGVTGSRYGMSEQQKHAFHRFLILQSDLCEVHHGDCVGADTDAHSIAKQALATICVHPPTNTKLRAGLIGDQNHEPRGYLARNRDIANHCDVLIATPNSDVEKPTGGTWYTVRYARRRGKPIIIIWPDGRVTKEGFNESIVHRVKPI